MHRVSINRHMKIDSGRYNAWAVMLDGFCFMPGSLLSIHWRQSPEEEEIVKGEAMTCKFGHRDNAFTMPSVSSGRTNSRTVRRKGTCGKPLASA